ncbi:MAG TPA: protease inhibitor I42 family protein [Chloroflexota bacterium]|nr:protease inhibitor I42 family protein [Chloroflexota bacterium]
MVRSLPMRLALTGVLVVSMLSVPGLLRLAAAQEASGCGAPAPDRSESAPAQDTLEASVEQEFSIRLPANPTTGYQWELAQPLDESILQLVSTTFERPEGPPRPGAGGTSVWTFLPLCAGTTTITLRYRRPWEPPAPTDREAVYVVVVH